jgi:hypothetical protein
MADPSIGAFLRRLVEALEEAEVPYMLVGSLASSVHGIPRSTRDLDLVVSLSRTAISKLHKLLPEEQYYFDVDMARESLKTRIAFNVIDMDTMWKADLIPVRGEEFARAEFARRVRVGFQDVDVMVASAEDTIVSKMVWAKKADSHQQVEDAAGVLVVQGEKLDLAYIEGWVAKLGLDEQWAAVRKLASDTE